MAHPAWSLTVEPQVSAALRQSLVSESTPEANFWGRDDLTYVGDLEWCEQGSMRGYEYIGDVQVLDEYITYRYGLINLDSADVVVGALVCDVRARRQPGFPFEMEINGQWLEGPLGFWLDQLSPAVQELARERYRLLIAWAECQIKS